MTRSSSRRTVARLVLTGWLSLCAALSAGSAAAQSPDTPRRVVPAASMSSPAWSSLTRAQQEALAPLQREWPSIDASRRSKWLEVAAKFPTMPVAERERIQTRMTDWSRLTPSERGQARQQFQEARQFAAEDRQAAWESYRALPEEQRAELAQRNKRPLTKPASPTTDSKTASSKRNLVPSATSATQVVKPVSPTVVQVKPGATTTLMSKAAKPPAHQQAGLPKVAATEGFVDPNTLLPKRGPQGAAVRPASAASVPHAAP